MLSLLPKKSILFSHGHFRGCSRMQGDKKTPVPKIFHIYSAMVKLSTVKPYQNTHESRDTPLEFF